MLTDTLLAGGELPDTFECQVRGRMALPQATIELHDYRFHRPQRALFQSSHAFLDLALSPRPGVPRGRYITAPGLAPRPMGNVIFIPADNGLSSEWGAGSQRSVCCRFETRPKEGHYDWKPDELEATLDVRSPFVREALLRLAREIESPGFCSELMAEALWTQMAIEVGRYFRAVSSPPEDARVRLSPAQLRRIEDMLERPGKPPSVAELATECGFSTRHFFRIFRATTDRTLSEFAAERRIVRAKMLLAEGKPTIKQIAYRCGFEMPAAFSAAFRRATGVSPREFRRQMAL